jgi:hypothetical protein
VNLVMNLSILKEMGNFSTSWATVTFSRTLPRLVACYLVDIALLHVLSRIVRNDFITTSVY